MQRRYTLDCFFCKRNEIILIGLVLNTFLKKFKGTLMQIWADLLPDKTLVDFTSLFSPYDFEKNDQIILSYF